MVAILEKGEFNSDFHPMVDFIAASPLRIETTDEGTHILVTVDGIQRTVSESSLRRNLKLKDEDGIVSIPDTKLFENLTLMGATIVKSSTLPHDSAPRVTSPTADEGSMQHNISKLTALCTSLQRQYSELQAKFQAQEEEIVKLKDRVKVLEDKEDVAVTQSGDDAPIKGMSINKGEAAAERISNNSEEIVRVLTSIDAATVLAGGIDVPTGSGFIPTAGPPATVISTGSKVGPTASPIATRRKGKEVMVESNTPKKKKLQEQIDAQSQQRRPMTKKQKREYYMAMIKSNLGWRFKDFKGMTFEEIVAKFAKVWKQVENFIPMGSKEKTERLKRKEWKLYDLSRVHHLTAKDREIFMLVEKDYPLRKG
nr:hypothetical protein [Tanacetum cinerariifolium]